MAKDTIFRERPPRVVNPIKQHTKFNATLEQMQREIRNASTVQEAVGILVEKFGRDYMLFIVQAIRETFQVSNEQIGKYL